MEQIDYYSVLGVDKQTTPQQVKESYRHLAFQYHPDRNGSSAEAMEKMKAVNEAYAVLSDPEKRREYDTLKDRFGGAAYNRFRQSYSDQDIFRGSDIHQVFEDMARSFGVRGFDELFKQFNGQRSRTFEYSRPGARLKGFVFSGGSVRGVPIPPLGKNLGSLSKRLLGKIVGNPIPERGNDIYDVFYLRPFHALQGGPFAYEHRKRSKKLVVRIPSGIKDGQKIRLAGMGDEGRAGGPPGDLYLKVKIKKPMLQNLKNIFGGLRSK